MRRSPVAYPTYRLRTHAEIKEGNLQTTSPWNPVRLISVNPLSVGEQQPLRPHISPSPRNESEKGRPTSRCPTCA
jgi:hypothetical protein